MSASRTCVRHSTAKAAMFALLAFAGITWAQVVPRSFVASPDVYKVIGEDSRYLVIEATWAPGQRDKAHSHPHHARYLLTNCNLRQIWPDGRVSDIGALAGKSAVRGVVESVSMENIGTSACKMIFFEPTETR